ncbi:MAG TPA: hypothetical protein PKZ20_20465, partial [Rhodocyclaceae bacterium]|nr:hypothetical protein [Rhodocyclaceae bacterium]
MSWIDHAIQPRPKEVVCGHPLSSENSQKLPLSGALPESLCKSDSPETLNQNNNLWVLQGR